MKTCAFVLAVAAAGCAMAGPDETAHDYLALGDSVAFGYDPLVDLNATEVTGYPEMLAEKRGLVVTNLACPGEATGGFVSPTGADNHCRENREQYPLHVAYDGTQLAAAVDYLRGHTPELVTIDIGANDIYLLDHICNRDLACIAENLVSTITAYRNNLDFIFAQLRKVYDGPLVAMTIYNPYPGDATAGYAIDQIDSVLAERIAVHHGILADGKAAFASASADPCAAGLLIRMPDGTCDVHPTPAGAAVLSDAIDAAIGSAPQ